MASYLSCPHCGKTLQVPDGCGGRATACPSCQGDFLIPGIAASSELAAVCAVVAPDAGSVTPADLERIRAEAQQLAADDVELLVQVARLKRRRDAVARRLAAARLCLSVRSRLDETLGRVGGFFVTITLGAAALVVVASFFGPSAGTYALVAAIGFLLTTALYMPLSFLPEDSVLVAFAQRLGREGGEAGALYDQAAAEQRRLGDKLLAARHELRRLTRALDGRLHWLRTCAWQGMTGREFERFLVEVFREHGYEVEATGRVGDQGVDLIVTRGGVRVAVQAKGYVGHSVGNDAVQQAHAGCTFHHCHRSAVVTNARFTTAARMLAERLHCRLIDRDGIPELIEGRIVL
jgi:hypothetical protein